MVANSGIPSQQIVAVDTDRTDKVIGIHMPQNMKESSLEILWSPNQRYAVIQNIECVVCDRVTHERIAIPLDITLLNWKGDSSGFVAYASKSHKPVFVRMPPRGSATVRMEAMDDAQSDRTVGSTLRRTVRYLHYRGYDSIPQEGCAVFAPDGEQVLLQGFLLMTHDGPEATAADPREFVWLSPNRPPVVHRMTLEEHRLPYVDVVSYLRDGRHVVGQSGDVEIDPKTSQVASYLTVVEPRRWLARKLIRLPQDSRLIAFVEQ